MRTLISGILFFFIVILALSQISMMAVFMGGESKDSIALLNLHNYLLIFMLVLCLFGFYQFYKLNPSNWLRVYWQRTPGWLIFSFCLLNTMILTGFWAFQIVTSVKVESVVWNDFLPLVSTFVSSLGFIIFYVFLEQKPQLSYAQRNAARAGKPPEWKDTWD